MQKYEYTQTLISLPENGLTHVEMLNSFGKEGWELLQMQQYDNRNFVYIFKRELQQSRKTLLMEGKKV